MSNTQHFSYKATLTNGTTISSLPTLECENILHALRLVNQLHEDAEEIVITKLKQNNV